MKERTITFDGYAESVTCIELPEVDSTNDYLKRRLTDYPAQSVIVRADFQTHGRGQFERTWESSAGQNVLFSILVHPKGAPLKMPLITTRTAHVVTDVLQRICGVPFQIKEPNDILYKKKKVVGILTEQVSRGIRVESLIVGIGINVNATKDGLVDGATSLFKISGERFDVHEICMKVAAAFFVMYDAEFAQ